MRYSSKLSKLLEDIVIGRGYGYIDPLLMNHAEHWSCPDTTEDDTVKAGIKMQIKSVKTGKPIYRLDCELFSVYFVADYATIKAWLNEAKDKADKAEAKADKAEAKDKYCSECGRLKS